MDTKNIIRKNRATNALYIFLYLLTIGATVAIMFLFMKTGTSVADQILAPGGTYLGIVAGNSMGPTLFDGQILFAGDPQVSRGDIVFIQPEGEWEIVTSKDPLVKRIVGCPGEHVQILKDGTVLINDRTLPEFYLDPFAKAETWPRHCSDDFVDVTLSEDQYYVMGDNREWSSDSRFFGPVPREAIPYSLETDFSHVIVCKLLFFFLLALFLPIGIGILFLNKLTKILDSWKDARMLPLPVDEEEKEYEKITSSPGYRTRSTIARILAILLTFCSLFGMEKFLSSREDLQNQLKIPINIVNGRSMFPTLHDGQILYSVTPRRYEASHIVKIHLPPEQRSSDGSADLVKRIVGVPGDHIQILEDDTVLINGSPISQSYLTPIARNNTYLQSSPPKYADLTLSDSQYFVMGDNRGSSYDSRSFGPVEKDCLTAVLVKKPMKTTVYTFLQNLLILVSFPVITLLAGMLLGDFYLDAYCRKIRRRNAGK